MAQMCVGKVLGPLTPTQTRLSKHYNAAVQNSQSPDVTKPRLYDLSGEFLTFFFMLSPLN